MSISSWPEPGNNAPKKPKLDIQSVLSCDLKFARSNTPFTETDGATIRVRDLIPTDTTAFPNIRSYRVTITDREAFLAQKTVEDVAEHYTESAPTIHLQTPCATATTTGWVTSATVWWEGTLHW